MPQCIIRCDKNECFIFTKKARCDMENKMNLQLQGEWWTLRSKSGQCLIMPTALLPVTSARKQLPPVLAMFCKTKSLAENLKQALEEESSVEQMDIYAGTERLRFLEFCGMRDETIQAMVRWIERDRNGKWQWRRIIDGALEQTEGG